MMSTEGILSFEKMEDLTIAKSVKFNVVDPTKDLPDLLQPGITEEPSWVEPEGTDVLLTKDKIAEEVEFVAKMMLEKKGLRQQGRPLPLREVGGVGRHRFQRLEKSLL